MHSHHSYGRVSWIQVTFVRAWRTESPFARHYRLLVILQLHQWA